MSDYTDLSDDELAERLDDLAARIQSEQRADWLDRALIASLESTAAAIRAEQNARTDRGQPKNWQGITDDALAVWALDKIAAATTERDRIRRNAQAYIDQIQQDALADEKPLTDRIAWFEGELRRYYESLPDRPKTYKLPNGQIQERAGRASTKVTEPDAFLAWARTWCPDAVKESPLTSPLKAITTATDDGQLVTADGEVVPGVEVVTGPPTVSIKPAGRPS